MLLDYSNNALPVWLVTDGCATGIAGAVVQGTDWNKAKVAAFFSAKLNSAQCNYPVHEIEMLAGIESMLRHRDILQGIKFKWITDHKGLIHLYQQRNLSGQQARWLEKLAKFDFEIVYVPGTENVLADALSRIWSNESPGTVRGRGAYTYHDLVDNENVDSFGITMPLLAGIEASCLEGEESWFIDSNAMSLRTDRCPSARAQGLDNNIVPGNLAPSRPVATNSASRGRRKEGGSGRKEKPAAMKTTEAKESEVKVPANVPDCTPAHDPELPAQPQIPLSNDAQVLTLSESPSLLTVLAEGRAGIDLRSIIRNKYSSDPLFRKILAQSKDFRNFEVEDGLIFLKMEDCKLLCIPDLVHKGHSMKEIVIDEAHSLLAHLGARKTLACLRDHVWWKTMAKDVESFCNSCTTCKHTKSSTQKPYGLLRPLNPPTYPWEIIGIDFMDFLPESKNWDGMFDMLTVIVDHLTGMVHLVPGRMNYKAKDVAELVFEEVYKLHGLPKGIVSDRDSLFTSLFWTHLHRLIGTKLKMSSAYHPERMA